MHSDDLAGVAKQDFQRAFVVFLLVLMSEMQTHLDSKSADQREISEIQLNLSED
jgi:hypothetical protein